MRKTEAAGKRLWKMSEQSILDCEILSRPAEIDEGSYLRILQTHRVGRVATPIIDHNIRLVEAAKKAKPWYRGMASEAPAEYLSLMLDPTSNSASGMLASFAEVVKQFDPGAFPAHCHATRVFAFTTKHLILTLSELLADIAPANALKQFGQFVAAFSDPSNAILAKHDYIQRIDAKLDAMLKSFAAVSRAFAQREREILFRSEPEQRFETAELVSKTNAILEIADETRSIVRRQEAREVARGKREREIERQEKNHAIWMRCKENGVLCKEARNGNVTYEQAFVYARAEFEAIGVHSAEEIGRLESRRSNRHSTAAKRKVECSLRER